MLVGFTIVIVLQLADLLKWKEKLLKNFCKKMILYQPLIWNLVHSQTVLQNLNAIIQIRFKVIEMKGRPHAWPTYFLSHKKISNYLMQVAKHLSEDTLPLMGQIVRPIDLKIIRQGIC